MIRSRFAAALLFALTAIHARAACTQFYTNAIQYSGGNCSNFSSAACTLSQPILFSPVIYSHTFDASCDTLTWDFGDGTPTVMKTDLNSVSHTYANAGTYTVKLTASNSVNQTVSAITISAANGVIYLSSIYSSQYENAGNFPVTISRTSSSGSATVHYATSDGTAVAGVRYTATSGTLTFNDGDLSKTINVPLIDDTKYEGQQYFYVTLSNPTGGFTVNGGSGTYYINDNDPPPAFSFPSTLTANEADGSATITVLRTGDTSSTNSVSWNASNSGVQAIVPAGGSLTFNPGDTAKTFSVSIVQDGIFTGPRTGYLYLSGATGGAIINNGYGYLTVNDAEAPPTISISDASITEGDSGTKSLTLTMTLSAPLKWTQYVNWVTHDGSAAAGRDYSFGSGTLVFNAGDTSKTLTVSVIGNTLPEPDKTFQVQPSIYYYSCCGPSNVVYPTHNGTVTILNDDLSFTPRSQSVASGTHALLTVNVGNPVTTDYVIPVTSSDPTIAKVPSSVTLRAGSAIVGIDVTAVAHGSTTITATLPAALGGQSFTAGVAVYDGTSLAFDPQPLHATAGSTVSVKASLSPVQPANVVVPLASVNPAVATVPPSITIPAGGSASFNVTAVAAGTTVITAILPAANGGATITLSVDVVAAPKGLTITQIAPSTGPLTGGTPVSLTGANFGSSCTLTFDGATATNVTTVSPTSVTATTPAHAAGSVDVTLTCGTDTFTLPGAFTYIATSATLSGITPGFGSVKGGTLTSISGTNFTPNCWAFFDDAAARHVSVSSATTILATTPAHNDGTVPVSLRCGGASVSLANAFTFSTADDPAPVITAVDPLSGSAGQSVHITGFRFRPTDRVTFDTTGATILSTTPESQYVRVPDLPVGKVSITLTDISGHTTTTGPIFSILEPLPPHIDAAAPTALADGDELDLTGSGFRPGYTFWVGGQPASIVELSYTHALVRVGAVDAGHYAIEAHNASGGTAAIGPSVDVVAGGVNVTAVAPLCGSSDGGTLVTITGSGFASGATVTFGGAAATSVTVIDAHTITAKAPAGSAGTARVVVTNVDGKSASLSDAFRYFSPMDPDGGCATPARRRPVH